MLKWNLKAIVWQIFLSWGFFSYWKEIDKLLFEGWERLCICSIYNLKGPCLVAKWSFEWKNKLSYIPYVKSDTWAFLSTLYAFHTSQDNKMFTPLSQKLIKAFMFTISSNLIPMPLELMMFHYGYRTTKIYIVLMYWYQWVTSLSLLAHNTAVYVLGYMHSCCTYVIFTVRLAFHRTNIELRFSFPCCSLIWTDLLHMKETDSFDCGIPEQWIPHVIEQTIYLCKCLFFHG